MFIKFQRCQGEQSVTLRSWCEAAGLGFSRSAPETPGMLRGLVTGLVEGNILTGNRAFPHEIQGSPVNFPFNQSSKIQVQLYSFFLHELSKVEVPKV